MTLTRDWTICAACKVISEPTYLCNLCFVDFCRDCWPIHVDYAHPGATLEDLQ